MYSNIEKLWTPTNFRQIFPFKVFSLFLAVNFVLLWNYFNKSHTSLRKSWKFVEIPNRIHSNNKNLIYISYTASKYSSFNHYYNRIYPAYSIPSIQYKTTQRNTTTDHRIIYQKNPRMILSFKCVALLRNSDILFKYVALLGEYERHEGEQHDK